MRWWWESVVGHPWLVGRPDLPGATVGRRARWLTIAAIVIANAIGTLVVVAFALLALPKPNDIDDRGTVIALNLGLAGVYVTLALVVGVLWGRRVVEGGKHGTERWLRSDRRPDAARAPPRPARAAARRARDRGAVDRRRARLRPARRHLRRPAARARRRHDGADGRPDDLLVRLLPRRAGAAARDRPRARARPAGAARRAGRRDPLGRRLDARHRGPARRPRADRHRRLHERRHHRHLAGGRDRRARLDRARSSARSRRCSPSTRPSTRSSRSGARCGASRRATTRSSCASGTAARWGSCRPASTRWPPACASASGCATCSAARSARRSPGARWSRRSASAARRATSRCCSSISSARRRWPTRRPPQEVVALLNEFFAEVVDVVERCGGWINKFEGDAALAIFGAPIELPQKEEQALRAARELALRLRALPELEAAIGVAAGEAVAGHVGAERRFEYTVIGDPVNEAARLCDLAKRQAPEMVLASGAALARVSGPERERWRLDGEATLRGRSAPTQLASPAGS